MSEIEPLPENVDLGFIARQNARILQGQEEIKAKLAGIEAQVAKHADENAVLTGPVGFADTPPGDRFAMVMRYAGEHIAWGAMERQIKQLQERLERLEEKQQ